MGNVTDPQSIEDDPKCENAKMSTYKGKASHQPSNCISDPFRASTAFMKLLLVPSYNVDVVLNMV